MWHYTYPRIFSSGKYKTKFPQVPPLGMLTPDDNNLANFLQSIMNKSWLAMTNRPSVFQQLPPTSLVNTIQCGWSQCVPNDHKYIALLSSYKDGGKHYMFSSSLWKMCLRMILYPASWALSTISACHTITLSASHAYSVV